MILHLLLVPGAAFLSGGAHIWEQELHPNATQLNHSLLALGLVFYCLSVTKTAILIAAFQRVSHSSTYSFLCFTGSWGTVTCNEWSCAVLWRTPDGQHTRERPKDESWSSCSIAHSVRVLFHKLRAGLKLMAIYLLDIYFREYICTTLQKWKMKILRKLLWTLLKSTSIKSTR